MTIYSFLFEDSITYGCIPVLFSEITDTIAPYHWGGWRNRTRVLVSRKDFLEGRIDLKVSFLLSLSPLLLLLKFEYRSSLSQFPFLSFEFSNNQSIKLERDFKQVCNMTQVSFSFNFSKMGIKFDSF